MKWWNDLWMNEGFACHLSTLGMKNIKNLGYDVDQINFNLRYQVLIKEEDEINSIPLSPDKIFNIRAQFNHMSYYKGESILSMIEHAVGERFFQKTLQYFLKNHLYDNIESEDLANALNQALKVYSHDDPFDGMDVSTVIKSWTKTRYFPTIIVNKINDTATTIRQAHLNPTTRKFVDSSWIIPIFYKESYDTDVIKMLWLKDNQTGNFISLF